VPLESAAVDLVFMSMVYHHLRDPEAAARECRRVLRPGGRVFLRNGTAEQIESYPYIDFFPGVRDIIVSRLATGAAIVAVFKAAGFAVRAQGVIAHPMASGWRDFTDKMALRADSFVAALPDQAFEAGMAALRAHADQADPGGPVTVNVEYFVFSAG
jgi:SAM-dependent methyltransferase